jgi:acyl carrier protein
MREAGGMSVQERVKQFVVENFYIKDPAAIGEDTSLITTGYVDSTGMLELIAYLEESCGIVIEDTEMTPANLETIGRIARFVARKLQKEAA